MRRLRGFTLIEIAVVLFIGALLISGVVQYVTAQVTAARLSATRTKQEAIKSALINFLARNNRLPCPAVSTLTIGTEAATPGTCTGTALNPAGTPLYSTGTVPWASLGMTSESALDGYGNRFTYQVVLTATNLSAVPTAGTQSVSGMKGAIQIFDSGARTNQTNNCTPGTATDNPCLAVAVIVSHGANGLGAFNDSGVQMALPAGADELDNVIAAVPANTDNAFVIKSFSGSSTNPFDDVVMALTPNDLLTPLTSGGGMQDYRAALNSSFTVIRNALIANSTRVGTFLCVAGNCSNSTNCVTAGSTCEVAQYTYTLPSAIPTVPASVANDPWGNPIVYVINSAAQPNGLDYTGLGGTVRDIRPATTLDITAFTLKSLGPNGADNACAGDDLCMSVSVGEFQTLASKFR